MSMNKPARVWVSNEKPKAGDILRVRAQMEHVMETGLRNDPATGQPRPRHIVHPRTRTSSSPSKPAKAAI